MKKILLFLSFILMSIGVFGTTYKLTQVTSVSAGNKYVFVQDNHAMNNTISSSALQTTTSYRTTGLSGTETYVWTLESATGGFYMKNVYLNSNQYLNNTSSTNVSFGNKNSVWTFSFSEGIALIQNSSNSNRFLGYTSSTSYAYKAYATSNLDTYAHEITVYVLEEETVIYTITPQSNNNSWGTVSLSGNVITGLPNNGYRVISGDEGYTVTSGTATVVNNEDNTFTVTPSSNCTIIINFEIIPTDTTYMCVPIDSLTSDDVFMIVGKKSGSYYAISNNGGTGNDPNGIQFIPIGDFIFTDSVNVLWTLTGNNSDGFTFYQFGDNTKWLYCNTNESTQHNNNLRVGTGSRNVFVFGNHNYGELDYLETKDSYAKRFLGVTNNHVWHSYVTIGQGEIDDESFYFYKRVPNLTEFHTACVRVFNNAGNDSTWTNRENWIFGKFPDDSIYGARIDTTVTVDTAHAVAKHVIINQNIGNGKIIIQPNKGLEVDSTIVVSKNNSYHPTTPNDLILESSSEGNASLIFNNTNENQATVCLYSRANIDRNSNPEKWNWQYIGTPMTSVNALYNYYGSWIYRWDGEQQNWVVVPNGGTMYPWVGYCITQETPEWYATTGTLIPTNNEVILNVPKNSDMVFTNSWTAPIHIGNITDEDFDIGESPKNIYLFNTGYAPHDQGGSTEASERYESGKHIVVPIHSAPYTGDSLISSQQGFFVTNTTNTDGTITLKYKDIVRTNGNKDIIAGQMHAPRRNDIKTSNKPNVLKIYANGSIYNDKVVILEREDFSKDFDNGWDGNKSSFGTISPSIYVVNENGTYDAVSAIPEFEGTVLGFKPGTDITYSLTFDYNGDETLYLNDMVTLESTLIDNDFKYTFTSNGNEEIRFIISSTPYSNVATKLDNVETSSMKKLIINGNVYIIHNRQMFNVLGQSIK